MDPLLTSRFDEALHYALSAHATQTRKGTDIPYAAHLLAVASLILEAGGSEDAAIAGLLHDVIEDQGPHHLDEIAARFGDRVADAVVECSAESKHDGLSWEERKQRYIEQMVIASPLALSVSLADKVHNLRSILADYRVLGHGLFTRFGAPGPEAIVWYYESLLAVYEDRAGEVSEPLVAELRRTLGQLRSLLRRPDCPNGHGDVVRVVMGMPDPELFEAADDGQVVLGGCVVGPESPDWACLVCHEQWRDESIERSW